MNAIKESFDNLPTAICIFSSKGLVRLMNRRMLRPFQRDRSASPGQAARP